LSASNKVMGPTSHEADPHVTWRVGIAALAGCLALVYSCASATSQTPANPRFPATTGSLNLVLANRNGFVIAADSRGREHPKGNQYRDRYQKLFRTGPRSALAIAGLLAGGVKPFELETIARIVRHFGPTGLNDGRGEPDMVGWWLEDEFRHQLQKLAAVLTTFKGYPGLDLRLIATVVGFNANGDIILEQVQFVPDGVVIGNIPTIKATLSKSVVHDFEWRAAGATGIAEAVLHGRLEAPMPALADYLQFRREGRLGSMSVEQMVGLAEVIFRETMSRERGVGGAVQMAMLPREGKGQWKLTPSSPLVTALGGSGLLIGATNPFMSRDWQEAAHWEWVQNFDSLETDYTFVKNHFHDLTIPLDQNDYYGNVFERCTFLYTGGTRISYGRNSETNCAVQIAPGVKNIPAIVTSLRHRCKAASPTTPRRPLLRTPRWTVTSFPPPAKGREE